MLEFILNLMNITIILITTVLVLVYIYLKKVVYTYWKVHGIPHDEPTFLIGTLDKELLQQKIPIGESIKRSYDKFKKYPFHGLYMFIYPTLMINDPEVIKDILIKNFDHFTDRGAYSSKELDPMSCNLFNLNGEEWKILRIKFTTTFTPAKLKNMVPLISEIADKAIKVSQEQLKNSDICDMKELLLRYTTDTIASLAFGIDSDTLNNPKSDFRYYGGLATQSRPLNDTMGFYTPNLLKFLRRPYLNKQATRFYMNLFRDMIAQRRRDGTKRNDIMNLIIELMENEQIIQTDNFDDSTLNDTIKEKACKKLELIDAMAQAFVFFVAGFETSASAVTYCLYELALNPDIQENLHKEIDDFFNSSKTLTFTELMQLEYLDMVFNETLRKYPVLASLNRICVKDYKLPNSNYVIPKGLRILVSTNGIHQDPNFYPEPDKFDPTRFNKQNTETRHPCTFLPFGIGPRYCIGKRFAILQSKFIIFSLLKNYEMSVCEKTVIPIKFSLTSLLQVPADPIYLRLQKRNH